MSNPRYNAPVNARGSDSAPQAMAGSKAATADMPMRTATWPGLPGKAGPDRSNGVPKLKNAHSKSEGI